MHGTFFFLLTHNESADSFADPVSVLRFRSREDAERSAEIHRAPYSGATPEIRTATAPRHLLVRWGLR